jgi:hypothetical protein
MQITWTIPDDARWAALLLPNTAKPREGFMRLIVLAEDVHAPEVAFVTVGAVTDLIRQGNARFPTEQENAAARAHEELLEKHPATRILGRSGEQVWIGDAAVEAGILTRLATIGWTDCGPVQVKGRACDHAIDPTIFEAKYLGPVENGAVTTPEA